MKKTIALLLSLVALTVSLSACQKSPEEKIADKLSDGHYDRDKEVKRLNAIGKDGDEALAKVLGTPKPPTPGSEKK